MILDTELGLRANIYEGPKWSDMPRAPWTIFWDTLCGCQYKSGAENKFGKKIEERSNLLRGCLIRGPTAPQITFFLSDVHLSNNFFPLLPQQLLQLVFKLGA